MKRLKAYASGATEPLSKTEPEDVYRDLVHYLTRVHEQHEAAALQIRASLSGGSWRLIVRERVRMADTPAIAAWWPCIY